MILCADPRSQFLAHQQEIEDAILRVVRGSFYISGDELKALEKEFAEFIGCGFAVGVANGTDALELALRAYDIGPGDEVITVSHTAVATVAAIEATGATPVLVDIEGSYYTINASQIEKMINKRTKAVIAVHLYGQPAELDKIVDICSEYKLALIEDVSQAHGSTYRGKKLGSIGDIGCFSCYPTKNLGAIGDAGLITTNDSELAKKIKMMREYGWERRYVSEFPGRNSRLDEVQAAILRVKLRFLDTYNSQRSAIANFYNETLLDTCKIPLVRAESDHVYHLYVVEVKNRDQIISRMNDLGISPGIHYPIPVHLQPAYKGRIISHPEMNVTESVCKKVISLPLYPELTEYNYVGSTFSDLIRANK